MGVPPFLLCPNHQRASPLTTARTNLPWSLANSFSLMFITGKYGSQDVAPVPLKYVFGVVLFCFLNLNVLNLNHSVQNCGGSSLARK